MEIRCINVPKGKIIQETGWLSTFTASQRVKGSAHGRHFIIAPGLATESNEINSSFI